MKTSRYICIMIFMAFACNVLDQEPQSEITEDIIFLNEQGVNAAIIGLYNALQGDPAGNAGYYGYAVPFATDQYADVTRFGGFFDEFLQLDQKNVPSTNNTAFVIWSDAYAAINLANIIIAQAPLVTDPGYSNEERTEDVAAAKAVRALCYFDLLRHFGEWWDNGSIYGLPIITESSGGDLANVTLKGRDDVGTVWQQIFEDLTDAQAGLASGGSGGRFELTSEFATAMLARYYLYTGDYTNAITEATRLIDDANYTLIENDYSEIFSSTENSEDIFKLVFNPQDQSDLATFTISREEVLPEDDLIDLVQADPNDQRAALLGTAGSSSFTRVLKYPDGANNTDPAIVVRLAEMYFIRAEARILGNGDLDAALADINIIRSRAGASDAAFTDQNSLIQVYLDETMREFFGEGFRFFALIRLNRHNEVLDIEDFRRIFPIPQQEVTIDGTPIVQNPGY